MSIKKIKDKENMLKKHDNYSFKHFYYLSFNCEFLAKYYNKNIINVYEAFNCLNQSKISIDTNEFITCEKCNSYCKFDESKTFYEVPNNLIIMFDRGENNENGLLIYFEEKIKFENWNVENNLKNEYYLVGAINEIIDNNEKKNILPLLKKIIIGFVVILIMKIMRL